MINTNKERKVAVLYTCGTCNLNCRYCNIDKSPILIDIDKQLEESFKGDYYFNQFKKYFPLPYMLHEVQTWGGEPFLRMERIYPLVHRLIEEYPYFNAMFSSTNFSFPEWIDKFMGLMQCFADYPEREFKYNLQLSIDGVKATNDRNRGEGVTDRCIANFDKLINLIKENKFPQNVTLEFQIKGTWDLDIIHNMTNKQNIIDFYQFYENNYIDKVAQLNNPKIIMGPAVPNTAVPAPTTVADGEAFAEVVRLCREIENENQFLHYFKYYDQITPFAGGLGEINLRTYNGGCGSGLDMIGFLPNNMLSICHEGFVEIVDAYKKHYAERPDDELSINIDKFVEQTPINMCLNEDAYAFHENLMESWNNGRESCRMATAINLIFALAMAGQVKIKYLNEYEALKAASYIRNNCSFCLKNNYNQLGSFFLEPVDLYKLLLNGALDLLLRTV